MTATLISAIAPCDRGVNEHLNGSGVLHEKGYQCNFTTREVKMDNTDVIMPERYSCDGSMTLPSSSTALKISNVARMDATVIQMDERARWRPGHCL